MSLIQSESMTSKRNKDLMGYIMDSTRVHFLAAELLRTALQKCAQRTFSVNPLQFGHAQHEEHEN